MPALTWTLNVQLDGGTALSLAAPKESIEGVDSVAVTLESGDSDVVVEVQPGAAEAIRLLVIKASTYSEDLTYVASDGSADADAVTLDGPHLYSAGSVPLFGLAPRQLKFSNASPDDVTIRVFVARDATP